MPQWGDRKSCIQSKGHKISLKKKKKKSNESKIK